jgi:glycosyltransferase involved in cell wall biosynthesis
MQRLRILVAHCAYQLYGGEDSVVEAEVALLKAHGHDVRVLMRRNADIDTMPRLQVARDTVWSSETTRLLEDTLRDWRPDVIHVHNTLLLLSPSIFWAARRQGIPIVQTLHNFRLGCLNATFLRDGKVCEDCLGRAPLAGVRHGCYRDSKAQSLVLAASVMTHRWLGTYTQQVDRYITLTQFARQKFIDMGLPAERLTVKPNFVPWCEAPRSTPRRGGLYVGRLSVEKGIGTLLQAWPLLGSARSEVAVLGAGPRETEARAVLGEQCMGHTPLAEVLTRMEQAAFLVLPSVCYEGFPRTVVEAFSRGLPVIASRLGSMAELIEDGQTGLLFEPGNPQALAERIVWALRNPQAMADMGRRARAVYEKEFTAERNHTYLMEVYAAAIDSNSNGHPGSRERVVPESASKTGTRDTRVGSDTMTLK